MGIYNIKFCVIVLVIRVPLWNNNTDDVLKLLRQNENPYPHATGSFLNGRRFCLYQNTKAHIINWRLKFEVSISYFIQREQFEVSVEPVYWNAYTHVAIFHTYYHLLKRANKMNVTKSVVLSLSLTLDGNVSKYGPGISFKTCISRKEGKNLHLCVFVSRH